MVVVAVVVVVVWCQALSREMRAQHAACWVGQSEAKKAMREGCAGELAGVEVGSKRGCWLLRAAAAAVSPNMRLRGMQRYDGVQLRNAASGNPMQMTPKSGSAAV